MPRIRLTAYSPKAKRIGSKLLAFREAANIGISEAAKHLGVEDETLRKYELGALLPGHEMRRRFVLFYFGKWSWASAPSAPAVIGRHRGPNVMERVRLTPDSKRRMKRLCKKFEGSPGAIIELALETLEENVPVITTIREAMRKYEDLRWKSILENNTDFNLILDGDPLLVRVAHSGQYTHAKDKLLDPKFLTAWLSSSEGTYIEAARIKWRRTEGNENV